MAPKTWEALDELAAFENVSTNEIIRRAVSSTLGGAGASAKRMHVPLLGSAPCGPWDEAKAAARKVDVGEAAERLKIQPDDYLIEASGISMISPDVRRHIPDGAWILFRPHLDPTNEIALCRARLTNGDYVWTIKRYQRGAAGLELLDGKGKPVDLPAEVEEVSSMGVFRGVITNHLDTKDSELKEEIQFLKDQIADQQKIIEASEGHYPAEWVAFARRARQSSVAQFVADAVHIIVELGDDEYKALRKKYVGLKRAENSRAA